MRPPASSLTFPLLLAGMVAAGPAAASPEYPGQLSELLDMGCVPQCTICHETNAGGIGSLKDRSFGAAAAEVPESGLEEREPERLGAILAELEEPDRDDLPPFNEPDGPWDTDHDGVSDVQELRQMRNPNVAGAGPDICGPLYGCGAAVARPRAAEGRTLPLLAALAAALTLVARARRR